ncbi:hypothetical protein Bbelb_121560 [Branchiostoma belcheri]|nr:hypothetical protein Bbelb_121560 [Branchiostoma belcheri]
MSDTNMTRLLEKLQNLELSLTSQHGQAVGYGQALREAILEEHDVMEVEVLKSLGDLKLQKAKLSKDLAEFDKAAALYAAALLRCKDPDMGETLEHRIRYMEKLSRQLLQGYSPHFRWLSPDYWGTADSNVLRVAEICDKLDRSVGNSCEQTYTDMLVTSVGNSDMFLELEVLKSLGDFYLEKGKTTSDVSQFSKAAAMYNKALTTCGDPGTKLTLEHRIRYMEKIREEVKKKPRPREREPHLRHQAGNIRTTEISQHLQTDRSSEYDNHLKEGDSSLARADLDSAEQHFAAALKIVHERGQASPPLAGPRRHSAEIRWEGGISKQFQRIVIEDGLKGMYGTWTRYPTAQKYQREVEPLCKLGDVYSKRGQQTGDGGDFVKTAALYNAAIARSQDKVLNGNIVTAIRELDNVFLKCIFDVDCVTQDSTEKHKKQLKEMREQIKLEMETIDQQLDPYVHDEDDPCVREIEAKRAQAVRQMFENIAQQRKEFISQLVEECIGLMGPPPCKYALMGLGSQATGLVTPYSDLEFAILVEDESEECLVYFRNLTHYLHLKVVNLGETILPALGIKSVNDFYSKNPLDDWYYDSVTPRGFAFDGSMPKASKTPLGRQGTKNEPPSELICTPQNMETKYSKADMERISNQETITARLIDVKKEIYRFPAVAVDCLALSSGIIPTTVWETIEEMATNNMGDSKNGISYFEQALQMCRSIYGQGTEHPGIALCLSNLGLAWDSLSDYKKAISCHEQALQMEKSMYDQTTAHPAIANSLNNLGTVFDHLGDYRKAICYYEQALQMYRSIYDQTTAHPLIATSLNNLGAAWEHMGDYKKAVSYYEQALQMHRSIYGQGTVHPGIATSLNNLGAAWEGLGDYKKAISYHEQSLQMERSIHGQGKAHPDIATSLSNIGDTCGRLGDYKKAISYHEQALQMCRSIYGQGKAHPEIAMSLNGLGEAWRNLGDYRKAISHYEQALQMDRSIYGKSTAHPEIGKSLNNLGLAWYHLGDYRKAISYYEQTLQIDRTIYGRGTAHPEIATTLNNLGMAWHHLSDYRKAISYYEQALQMYRSIYGQGAAHSDNVRSLNNLGEAWRNLGDYRKAISYYEQVLKMCRSIYGPSTEHPEIASSLNNLGLAWYYLGDHTKAISCYEQALQMYRSIFGKTTPHPDIAASLNNLGEACRHLGNQREAISYLEQALQMRRSIYGLRTAHPDIVISLNNIGGAWHDLGDYRKAIRNYEQALKMLKSFYGQSTAHPEIATLFNNLGMAWYHQSDYRKAINYHEQALQMYRSIYGQGATHPDIAMSLNNQGLAWYKLSEHSTALNLFQEALTMAKQVFPQDSNHPLIKVTEESIASIMVHQFLFSNCT